MVAVASSPIAIPFSRSTTEFLPIAIDASAFALAKVPIAVEFPAFEDAAVPNAIPWLLVAVTVAPLPMAIPCSR